MPAGGSAIQAICPPALDRSSPPPHNKLGVNSHCNVGNPTKTREELFDIILERCTVQIAVSRPGQHVA